MLHFRVVLLFPNLQVLVHKHHLSRCHHRLFGRRGKKNDEHSGEVLYLAQLLMWKHASPHQHQIPKALIFHLLLKKKKKKKTLCWSEVTTTLPFSSERIRCLVLLGWSSSWVAEIFRRERERVCTAKFRWEQGVPLRSSNVEADTEKRQIL